MTLLSVLISVATDMRWSRAYDFVAHLATENVRVEVNIYACRVSADARYWHTDEQGELTILLMRRAGLCLLTQSFNSMVF
jgi:hypothetical protein